jgi:hypothetical protein
MGNLEQRVGLAKLGVVRNFLPMPSLYHTANEFKQKAPGENLGLVLPYNHKKAPTSIGGRGDHPTMTTLRALFPGGAESLISTVFIVGLLTSTSTSS